MMEMQEYPQGFARTLGYARALMTKAVIVFGVGAIAELLAPDPIKPSILFGTFSGRHDQAQLDAARAAQVQTAREVAIAQAAPPAAYQQETIVLQHQQQALAGALGTQALAANVADFACIAARLWTDPGRDWRELRDTMRDLGCGLGDEFRGNIVRQQAEVARQGGAIVPRTAAPDPARMPPAPSPAAPASSPVARPAQVASAGPPLTIVDARRLTDAELQARLNHAYAPGRQLSPEQERERAIMGAEWQRRRIQP